MAKFQMPQTISRLVISVFGLMISTISPVLAGAVDITSLGHGSLLIKGGGYSVLLNPFKAVGCAAGLEEPKLNVDIILASSQLADEGARVAKGTFLVDSGSYRIRGLNVEGFLVDHDRFGGRRFGKATIWKWEQGGLNFAHLGGAAAQLTFEDEILIGRPDVLIIGVGGGAKIFNGVEAATIVKNLKPKRVIPVNYIKGEPLDNCDQNGLDLFLESMRDATVKKVGKTFSLSKSIDNRLLINIME